MVGLSTEVNQSGSFSTTRTGAATRAPTGWWPPATAGTHPSWPPAPTWSTRAVCVWTPCTRYQGFVVVKTVCSSSLSEQVTRQPWLISSDLGWLTDPGLRVECVQFQDGANKLLNNYKQKLRKKNDINRNKVIYNY